jgi:hypothetical protein
MRNTRAISLFFLLALLAAAPAAEAKDPRPVVKSVSPLRASVGEVMTIQGRNFTPGDDKNVVVLVSDDGRVRYVRAGSSTTDSLSMRVPDKIERLLNVVNGVRVATRFRVKVISTRMGRLATGPLAKPTIGPDVGGDCDKDGIPNPTDADDDADLLPDSIELVARTNPCLPDTDGDSLLDGWEYMSAIDLNRNALPYPGKRPFPNALYADAAEDFDGDGLWAWNEHQLWVLGGKKYPLSYSDGDQYTHPIPTGATWWNDFDSNNRQSDDERDFDGDALANIYELRLGDFEPWQPWFPGTIRPNYIDADTDGDGIHDGGDDQDHDDVSNIDELVNGTWAMNPCDPDRFSRTCPRWLVPGEEPQPPENVCTSRTLLSGANIKWHDYTLPEELDAEELAKFC